MAKDQRCVPYAYQFIQNNKDGHKADEDSGERNIFRRLYAADFVDLQNNIHVKTNKRQEGKKIE